MRTMIRSADKQGSLFSRVMEWVALAAVMHLCLFRFFETTTFWFTYDNTFKTITFSVAVGLGVLRLMTGLVTDYQQAEDRKNKATVILKGILAVAFSVPCFIIAVLFDYKEFAFIPFAAFCLYGMDTDKVLKAFTICIGTMLAVTILNALSGSIQNILYLGQGKKGRLRGSYGVGYPTDFASYFVYLFLFFWAVQRRNTPGHTAVFFILALLMTYGIYTYPRSNTSTICSAVIAIVVLFDGLNEKIFIRHKGTKWISKVADVLAIGAFPLLGAGIYGLAWLYGHGNGFAVRMDQWLSSRIRWIWESFTKYGIHAFGALTPQNGGGGGLIHSETYEFLDSTYGLLLIRYGWVLTLIAAFLWAWMTRRAIRAGHRRLALAMAVIAFHSASEHHFPELNYNLLFAMPLCSLALIQRTEEKRGVEKKSVAGWLAGVAVAVPAVLLLPRLLSWTRSLVAIEGWAASGERALSALFYWLFWVVLLILLWLFLRKLMTQVIERKGYTRALIGLITVFLAGAAGLWWSNGQIITKGHAYQPQLAEDESAVTAILDVAQDPVYAGQMEEIYKRSFQGISDRILSSEELCRSGRGSILLEHDNEGYQLINSGALYTEISPYTGLFTYDDTVIEELSAKSYRFHGYYSAERQVDLSKEAWRNGLELTEDGSLKLKGTEHSLVFGPYLDQFAGSYTVSFTLRLTDVSIRNQDADREICTLRASALWGQNIRSEQIIRVDDFDAENKLTVSLNYSVGSTRGIEYLVFCRDNTEVLVDRIVWRSNPSIDVWRKYTEEGLVQSERYFTTEGDPLEQTAGHYGVAYEYVKGGTDRSRTQYLDSDGKTLKKISKGYAQILDQWDDLHHITEERYLDVTGNPCLCTGNYSGYQRDYDPRGNTTAIHYFDTDDMPIRATNGYAMAEWAYDADNNQTYERYLNENGEPILLSSGYAERHREYNNEHKVIKETYFGTDREPICLAKGQAGVYYEYDDDGNTTCWRYLSKDGHPVMLTDGWAEMHRKYDDKKRVIEESYYDQTGKPILNPSGYAVLQRQYDNTGNVIRECYLNEGGTAALNTSGYAEVRKDYNSDNHVVRESYYDADGQPVALSKNQAAIEYQYDTAGNCVFYRYLGTDGQPVLLTDGWAEIHRVYNGKRQITEESYYDTNGNPILLPSGYAAAEYAYDDANNRNYERYLDKEHKPILNTSGYAELHRVFNINNRVIKETYYDETGKPVTLSKNQSGVEYDYDVAGNTILIRYLNQDGKPVQLTDNYCEIKRVYSASRKLLEESYYDPEGRPSNIYGRYAGLQNVYDEEDQLSLTYYSDAAGDPVECGSSYFHEYLQSLKHLRDSIIIIISVRDEATNSLTGTLLNDLYEIGVQTELEGKYRYSYYAVITPEGSMEELSNTETVSYTGQFGNNYYTVVSGGCLVGNTSSIVINDTEYSKNTRGMNFVILDSNTYEVLEAIAFDTYAQDMWVTR